MVRCQPRLLWCIFCSSQFHFGGLSSSSIRRQTKRTQLCCAARKPISSGTNGSSWFLNVRHSATIFSPKRDVTFQGVFVPPVLVVYTSSFSSSSRVRFVCCLTFPLVSHPRQSQLVFPRLCLLVPLYCLRNQREVHHCSC